MKLWQKIFLYTLMLVMLAVSITSILLLENSFHLALGQKKQSAYTEHEFLISNFKSLLLSERLRQNVILLENSQVIQYMEHTFEDENVKSGISFYDKNLNPVYQKQSLSNQGELLSVVAESGESYMQTRGNYLYILSKETLETKVYYFLTVTDMSDVLQMHKNMLDNVQNTSMVCAVAIAVILLVVVKMLLNPLQKINDGTRAIAQGEYEKRIPEKGRDEISELAHNMNLMAQAVEQNIRALEDVAEDRKLFIDNLSHEMKTPLTSILGFSDLLQIKTDLSEEQRTEYLGIIKDEASRMRVLSGKLMEMITVGEANVEWQQMEVQQVFSEMEASLGVIVNSHGMELSCQCEKGKLWMDRELMKSLVYNLTDNAIKASREGDTIAVRGWFERDIFFFSVTDTGTGIPKEAIEKITQAFYMVDKVRSRAHGGAGLGLALCVEIARIHRGNLRIESEPGHGTTVTVRMKGGQPHEER